MQTDVGIGVDPVSARRVAAIDQRDRRVGVREQCVSKRHRRGPGADDQIVRVELVVHDVAIIVRNVTSVPSAAPPDLTDAVSVATLPRVLGMKRSRKPDALKGTLDLLVLKTLSRGPQHGYGIAAHIQQVTTDALRVEEGSLYPALHRMEQAGWIAAKWEVTENARRARIYRLTRRGEQQLEEQERTWALLTKAVGRLLRFAGG